MGTKYYCQVSQVSWLYPDSVFGFILPCPTMQKNKKPYASRLSCLHTCGWEGPVSPAHLWPQGWSSPAFYPPWGLLEVPGETSCIFSYWCGAVSGITCFPGKNCSRRFWEACVPTKSQHLLISCPLPLLSCFYVTTARKFTVTFSSTKWNISRKSKWGLSLQVIPSPASPDPASWIFGAP